MKIFNSSTFFSVWFSNYENNSVINEYKNLNIVFEMVLTTWEWFEKFRQDFILNAFNNMRNILMFVSHQTWLWHILTHVFIIINILSLDVIVAIWVSPGNWFRCPLMAADQCPYNYFQLTSWLTTFLHNFSIDRPLSQCGKYIWCHIINCYITNNIALGSCIGLSCQKIDTDLNPVAK